MSTSDSPASSTEAYAAVEKASRSSRGTLYAPSVLERAAELLTDMWAAGERHGVTAPEWAWAVDLAGGALDVVSRRYERPEKERTNVSPSRTARRTGTAFTPARPSPATPPPARRPARPAGSARAVAGSGSG